MGKSDMNSVIQANSEKEGFKTRTCMKMPELGTNACTVEIGVKNTSEQRPPLLSDQYLRNYPVHQLNPQ